MRLWIDTDIGDNPDDVVALACAHAHPDVEVVGVSVVGGHDPERAEFARRYVDAPVSEPDGSLGARFAAARPDALLAIGPLTNVPRLMDAVPGAPVTLMGGVVVPQHHRGSVRTVEHNLGSDPTAAAAVLARAGAVVVPLDVTVSMRVGPLALTRLVGAIPRLDDEVARWVARVHETSGVPVDEVALVLHDPLALLVCARDDASGVVLERRAFDVDTTGALVDGDHPHDIAVRVDAPRAMARVLELVG